MDEIDPYNPQPPAAEYIQRMSEELKQLIRRLENLTGFMETKSFAELSDLKRELLIQQKKEMTAYAGTLSLRYYMAWLEPKKV